MTDHDGKLAGQSAIDQRIAMLQQGTRDYADTFDWRLEPAEPLTIFPAAMENLLAAEYELTEALYHTGEWEPFFDQIQSAISMLRSLRRAPLAADVALAPAV